MKIVITIMVILSLAACSMPLTYSQIDPNDPTPPKYNESKGCYESSNAFEQSLRLVLIPVTIVAQVSKMAAYRKKEKMRICY